MPKSKTKANKKATKPSTSVLSVIKSLQTLVEDHEAWRIDEALRLRQLHTSLEKLIKLQAPTAKPVIPTRTKESFLQFETWLCTHGLDLSETSFRIGFVDDDVENATLFATKDIAENEMVLTVPESVMLTAETNSSPLAPLLTAVPTLTTMPSIRLALHLLAEASNPKSSFAPYIETLPSKFSIPFATFSPDEYLAMHPSPAGSGAIKSLRAQVRNYTYIYQALHRMKLSTLSTSLVTYQNYVWAVSIVMSRQNAIPIKQPPTLALVPVWDLCNHEPGEYTTAVVLSDKGMVVECRAMKNFVVDQAVTIYYGPRPNTQMLLFSGFIVHDNKSDRVDVKIPMRADIELSAFKARVLARMGIDVFPDEEGWVFPVEVGAETGVEGALAVARVLGMDKGAVTDLLKSGSGLPDDGVASGDRNARELVRNAIEERLKLYPEGVQEGVTLSVQAGRLIEQLHEEEKMLLKRLMEQLDRDAGDCEETCNASS